MGNEAKCIARLGSKSSEGKALLETDELIFRGDFRIVAAYSALTSVTANKGVLILEGPFGKASFELGAQAEKWAEKILNPPTLFSKLGVKPGAEVCLEGDFERSFTTGLSAIASLRDAPSKSTALLFFGIEKKKDLTRLATLRKKTGDETAIWVVYPKGKADPRELDVLEAGRAAGLKDNKVARFSETHTALRFVVPLEARTTVKKSAVKNTAAKR